MEYNVTSYTDEFWGAKITDYEYEVYEAYDGEVFEIVADLIKDKGYDYIPDEIEVEANGRKGEREFVIDPYDYLSKEEIQELEDMIFEEE